MHWNMSFVVRQSRGRFFTWLAHDDSLEAEFLEQTVSYLSKNQQTVLVTGDFSCIDENGAEQNIARLERLRDNISFDDRIVPFFEYGNSNIYFSFYGLIRTEICDKVMHKVKEPYMADGYEYFILSRLATSGEIASLPLILRKYRVHSSSTYNSEVIHNKNRPAFIRNFNKFINLSLLRIDFWFVLVTSSLRVRAKYNIMRRHVIMGWKWFWFHFGEITSKLFKSLTLRDTRTP